MAVIEDMEVEVVSVSSGEPLVEYRHADLDAEAKDRETQAYIEAITGSEFKIVVGLKKGFNYHGADGITIHLTIDGDVLSRTKYRSRPYGASATSRLTEDVKVEWTDILVGSGDNWSKVAFSFGAADIDENLHLDKTSFDRMFAKLGRIEVVIERVHSKRVKAGWNKEAQRLLPPSQGLDGKLLAKSISHTFKPGTARTAAAPSQSKSRQTRLTGKFGKSSAYVFFYRSRLALQALGCLPSTPEPVSLAERSPPDMTNREKDGLIVQLRAENETYRNEIQRLTQEAQAQAQEVQEARDLKAKMAAFVGNAATATSSAPQSANVKAERIKRERTDDTSTPTRPAKRPQPEYVNLD